MTTAGAMRAAGYQGGSSHASRGPQPGTGDPCTFRASLTVDAGDQAAAAAPGAGRDGTAQEAEMLPDARTPAPQHVSSAPGTRTALDQVGRAN